MNKKTFAVFTAALLLVGGAAAQVQQPTNRPSTNIEATLINTDPVPLQSGEDAEINFKLRNIGNTVAENVKVRIVDSFPFSLKPDRQRNYSLGRIVPGEEYHISTEVLVADNSPDGFNDFKVKVIQGDFSKTIDVPIQVQSQDIEMNLANLKTTPSSLTPDTEDAKMTVQVVNNGEKTAENVVLEIDLPRHFRETSSFSTRQSLGNVAPGQVKTAEFTFDVQEQATKGDVKIPAEISYSTEDSGSSSRITEDAGFSFYLSGKPQFQVTGVESQLKVGETKELRIRVKNTGSEKSTSTRIRVLDSSDLPFSYTSASKYVGTLEPNQTGTAVFEVETESGAPAKDYLIDFEVRGKNDQIYVEDRTVKVGVSEAENPGSSGLPLLVAAAIIIISAGLIYWFRYREEGEAEE